MGNKLSEKKNVKLHEWFYIESQPFKAQVRVKIRSAALTLDWSATARECRDPSNRGSAQPRLSVPIIILLLQTYCIVGAIVNVLSILTFQKVEILSSLL